MSIGVFYGSTTGVTKEIAETIAEKLGADVFDVADASAAKLSDYDVLVLGSSTWGMGELQDNWADFLPSIDAASLAGKKVALFGSGDQSGFSDTFGDALALIHDALAPGGCAFIGSWPADGYDGAGNSFKDGKILGLMLDDNNQSDLTAGRIDQWVEQIKGEMA